MFARLLSLFRKRNPPKAASAQQNLVDYFRKCSFCGWDRFYEGPSGGLSQNMTCSRCGARFNIGLLPDGPILLNTLSGPTEEPYVKK